MDLRGGAARDGGYADAGLAKLRDTADQYGTDQCEADEHEQTGRNPLPERWLDDFLDTRRTMMRIVGHALLMALESHPAIIRSPADSLAIHKLTDEAAISNVFTPIEWEDRYARKRGDKTVGIPSVPLFVPHGYEGEAALAISHIIRNAGVFGKDPQFRKTHEAARKLADGLRHNSFKFAERASVEVSNDFVKRGFPELRGMIEVTFHTLSAGRPRRTPAKSGLTSRAKDKQAKRRNGARDKSA